MPLQAIAIDNFHAKLMRETTHPDELKQRITDLYEHDNEHHSFKTGKQAIDHFEQAFYHNHKLYVGMFNDKPICAIGYFFDQDANSDQNSHRLDELAMHLQNKDRGIEEQIIKLILQDNPTISAKYYSRDQKIDKILQKVKNTLKKP